MKNNLIALAGLALALSANATTSPETPAGNTAPAVNSATTTHPQASNTKKEAVKECKKEGLKGKEFKDCVNKKTNG